jgi:hypothetical protein
VVRNALLVSLVAVACGPKSGGDTTPVPSTPADLPSKVVAEFERTTLAGVDEWVGQFDFVAVGQYEILLHRYDLLGRLPNLTEAEKAQYAAEDGTPYPPERERKNVGNFYKILAQRTVGTGGCRAETPRFRYNQLMGAPFEPLPPGNESHEPLRLTVNAYLENDQGGVIGIRCTGGAGGLALVYTKRDTPRGYDLITIYDDGSK